LEKGFGRVFLGWKKEKKETPPPPPPPKKASLNRNSLQRQYGTGCKYAGYIRGLYVENL
jgi:hypothetical protein